MPLSQGLLSQIARDALWVSEDVATDGAELPLQIGCVVAQTGERGVQSIAAREVERNAMELAQPSPKLSTHIAQLADNAVNRHIQQINADNAKWGINLSEEESLIQSHFRRGLCGESCDAVLSSLQDTSLHGRVQKINAGYRGEVHFFLQSPDGEIFIEPTWKQIVVSRSEEQTNPTEIANKLNSFPDVFVGSKSQFSKQVANSCATLNKHHLISEVLNYWGINQDGRFI
ncbi:hypothetical protein KUG47_03755 [Falsochrobactrum sp. TDYN1]|uniref:Uncharacterized protein n=1 Tax=Falsochrobactrum tianjinense TaxID=2706015 RepID=A0A949PMC0_9HYPH|nr:hypothetical protein [Falsochrobactrum sp. TDYN1]MBV2142614.1 hypothetical protein [Falsochrobactrum sp. TDYN1]